MVDQPPRFRIKIQSAHAEVHHEEPAQEYVYHWDRIIGALVALLLLLGGLGYGVSAWLKPSSLPAETALPEQHIPNQMVVSRPSPPREEAASASASLSSERLPAKAPAATSETTGPLAIADAPAQNTPDARPSMPEPPSGPHTEHVTIAPAQITPPPVAEIAESGGGGVEEETSAWSPSLEVVPATTMPPTAPEAAAPAVTAGMSVSQPSGAEPHRSEEAALSEPVPKSSPADATAISPSETTEVASEPDSDASSQQSRHGLFRLTDTSIASPAVKRFLLAKDVVRHEPRGDVGDMVPNAAGYVAISSFSEVTGQQGDTLQYRWLHNNKEVLRIRVPVGSDRWRSHSTKRIYAGMTGSWRAELRNSAGELLASIDFTF
jgi:hypothetical protein